MINGEHYVNCQAVRVSDIGVSRFVDIKDQRCLGVNVKGLIAVGA